MSGLLGRSVFGAAIALVGLGSLSPALPRVRAQSGDEVSADPEGSRSRRHRRSHRSRSRANTRDEVIADPELGADSSANGGPEAARWDDIEEADSVSSGSTSSGPSADDPSGADEVMTYDDEASTSASAGTSEYDPQANTGIARLEAIGQFGADIRHEGDLEDAYETRLRFDAEIEFRRSRKVRLSVGLRTDLLWALPAGSDALLTVKADKEAGTVARSYTPFDQDRFELDLLPLSAYVDVTPVSGFHLRLGTQQVSMARMDFYSPIDILAAFDLRGQAKVTPSGGKLAQPAIRVDWDLGSWATLQVVYLPWFTPNLSRPNRDRYVAGVLGTGSTNQPLEDNKLIDPGFQTKASESAIRFIGPAPDFTTPQAQARLNMRGSGFEVAVSGGTAIEKMPSIYLTPTADDALRGELKDADKVLGQAITNGEAVLDVQYHRYALVGLDGSLDVGPFSFGFELAYSPSRHLAAATYDASHLPQPNVSVPIGDAGDEGLGGVRDRTIRKGVPIVQGALHVEYLRGETFVVAAEGFMIKTLQLPYDLTRDWWGFIPNTGIFAGGLLGVSYRPNPDDNRWRFDLSLVSLVGPSLIAMPQVEFRVIDGFFLNMGAQLFEGPKQKLRGGPQNINAGGLYAGYNQMMFGFRYVP